LLKGLWLHVGPENLGAVRVNNRSYKEDLRELVRYLEMGPRAYGAGSVQLEPGWVDENGWVSGEDATKFVVEQTKLWRETWVLPKLRRLLAREEHRLSKRRTSRGSS
jgi:hypothetical protein